jgi:hypothetical protein
MSTGVRCISLPATPQIFSNPDAMPLFFAGLRAAEPELQSWGLGLIGALAQQSLANQAACDKAGVNALLIAWLADAGTPRDRQDALATLLQVCWLCGCWPCTVSNLLQEVWLQRAWPCRPPLARLP